MIKPNLTEDEIDHYADAYREKMEDETGLCYRIWWTEVQEDNSISVRLREIEVDPPERYPTLDFQSLQLDRYWMATNHY